jgi:hypothetical protein
MLYSPIMKRFKVSAGVNSTEDGVCPSIVTHPIERHESNVRSAHDPLPEVIDAMVDMDS